jgi:hypothetical protein
MASEKTKKAKKNRTAALDKGHASGSGAQLGSECCDAGRQGYQQKL